MKSSTGIVMEIHKRQASIMTNNGQFLKVKLGKQIPSVGEIYTGEILVKTPYHKYAAAAASLVFILLSGTVSYAYYTPTASVVVNINPSIELKVNRWDRILKTIPLNDDGKVVLASIDIKNKSLTEGLDLIVDEAKKDNFINEDYIQSGKTITVSVEKSKSNKKPDISRFEEYAKKNNLKVNVIKSKDAQPESLDNENKASTPASDKQNKNIDNENKQPNNSEENNKNKEVKKPDANSDAPNSPKDKNKDNEGNGNKNDNNNSNSSSSNWKNQDLISNQPNSTNGKNSNKNGDKSKTKDDSKDNQNNQKNESKGKN